MNTAPLTHSDRDHLDDHDVVQLDDRVGLPPHAQHVEEVLAG